MLFIRSIPGHDYRRLNGYGVHICVLPSCFTAIDINSGVMLSVQVRSNVRVKCILRIYAKIHKNVYQIGALLNRRAALSFWTLGSPNVQNVPFTSIVPFKHLDKHRAIQRETEPAHGSERWWWWKWMIFHISSVEVECVFFVHSTRCNQSVHSLPARLKPHHLSKSHQSQYFSQGQHTCVHTADKHLGILLQLNLQRQSTSSCNARIEQDMCFRLHKISLKL